MSIDVLQEKIRKVKNPLVVDLALNTSDLPPQLLDKSESKAKAYERFCCELMSGLKGLVCGVRVSFTAFAILGAEGLDSLRQVLTAAKAGGYYVVLEAPYILSPMMAAAVAEAVWGENPLYPCDGLIISACPGSDVIKPFLPFVKAEKNLFPVVRTSNKSAPELQDLLTGSRLVHGAAADLVNRFCGDSIGKFGYGGVGAVAGGNSAESLRNLRVKYPRLFLLVDDIDYSGCNAKICGNAFDKFGHGAAVCAGPSVTAAWKTEESDGQEYVTQAVEAAERLKRNLTHYTTIL